MTSHAFVIPLNSRGLLSQQATNKGFENQQDFIWYIVFFSRRSLRSCQNSVQATYFTGLVAVPVMW